MFRRIEALIISTTFVCCVLSGCWHSDSNLSTGDYWYTCDSVSIEAEEGYEQTVCSYIYSEGYYYLTIMGHKADDYMFADDYYKLYSVSEDNMVSRIIDIPIECRSTSSQVIVNEHLICYNTESSKLYEISIEDGTILNEEYSEDYIIGLYSYKAGYVKLTDEEIISYESNGNMVGCVSLEGIAGLYYSSPFYCDGDKAYLVAYSGVGFDVYSIDFENGSYDKIIDSYVVDAPLDRIENGLFFTYNGIYRFDVDSVDLMPITEWNYVDVKPSSKRLKVEQYVSYGEDKFGVIYTYTDGEIELIVFENMPEEEYSNRTILTVGGYGVETSLALKWAVYLYNTSQDSYRVFLDEYGYRFPYTTGIEAQEQTASLIQYFNNGNAPDVYYGLSFDYRYMFQTGMLADMLPFIEADSEFDLSEMIPSIRDTVCNGGVCYEIFPAFIFNGDFGLRRVYGCDSDVTYQEISELSQLMDISIQGDIQSSEIADQILRYSVNSILDNSGDNDFLSEEELLSIVHYSIDNGISCNSWGNTIADMDSIHYGEYLKCRRFLNNIYELANIENQYNERYVYLGFPSVYSATHAAEPDGLVAISADSDYQDECWTFIRYMFSDVVQQVEISENKNPVMNDAYMCLCNYASDPNLVPSDDRIWQSIVNGREPICDWIIEDYCSMVESIDSIVSYDWGLYNLICDEINSYYLQGKPEEAIAESLYSRLNLYVEEVYY